MNTLLVVAVVAVIVVTAYLLKMRSRVARVQQVVAFSDLTEGEKKVDAIIGQIYGEAVLTRSFVREADGVHVHLTLDTSKAPVKQLNINLSSLAKKQREGLSDAALKESLSF